MRALPFPLWMGTLLLAFAVVLLTAGIEPHIIGHYGMLTAVLLMESYVLFQMRREERERRSTMNALQSFRAALGREVYLEQICALISDAVNEVRFTSASMEASWHSRDQRRIFDAVKARSQRSAYTHRGIVAETDKVLPGAIELMCTTKVELRMSSVLSYTRVRFAIQDESRSVLGVPSREPERLGVALADYPSDSSFSIESKLLASSLIDKFDEMWLEAKCPFVYLNGWIKSNKAPLKALTQADVLEFLGARKSEGYQEIIRTLKEKCSEFAALPESTLKESSGSQVTSKSNSNSNKSV